MADTLNDLADLALGMQERLEELTEDSESYDADFQKIHVALKTLANQTETNATAIAHLTELFETFTNDIMPLIAKAKQLEKMSPLGMIKRGRA